MKTQLFFVAALMLFSQQSLAQVATASPTGQGPILPSPPTPAKLVGGVRFDFPVPSTYSYQVMIDFSVTVSGAKIIATRAVRGTLDTYVLTPKDYVPTTGKLIGEAKFDEQYEWTKDLQTGVYGWKLVSVSGSVVETFDTVRPDTPPGTVIVNYLKDSLTYRVAYPGNSGPFAPAFQHIFLEAWQHQVQQKVDTPIYESNYVNGGILSSVKRTIKRHKWQAAIQPFTKSYVDATDPMDIPWPMLKINGSDAWGDLGLLGVKMSFGSEGYQFDAIQNLGVGNSGTFYTTDKTDYILLFANSTDPNLANYSVINASSANTFSSSPEGDLIVTSNVAKADKKTFLSYSAVRSDPYGDPSRAVPQRTVERNLTIGRVKPLNGAVVSMPSKISIVDTTYSPSSTKSAEISYGFVDHGTILSDFYWEPISASLSPGAAGIYLDNAKLWIDSVEAFLKNADADLMIPANKEPVRMQ